MLLTLSLLATGHLLCALFMIVEMGRAPEAFEDETGFHFGDMDEEHWHAAHAVPQSASVGCAGLH